MVKSRGPVTRWLPDYHSAAFAALQGALLARLGLLVRRSSPGGQPHYRGGVDVMPTTTFTDPRLCTALVTYWLAFAGNIIENRPLS